MSAHEGMRVHANHKDIVDLVVVRSKGGFDGDVLLVRRRYPPFKDYWALPGGHVDPGELPLAAAVRELEEETNLVVKSSLLTPVGVYDAPGRDPRGPTTSYAYYVEIHRSIEATAGDDAAEILWQPLHSLGEVDLAFDHAEIIGDALSCSPA